MAGDADGKRTFIDCANYKRISPCFEKHTMQ